MAKLAAEKVFNINNIKSAKKIFDVCPKFIDYMTINGDTNLAIRSHPCTFSLPTIHLPDRVDKAAAKYLRDNVMMSPKDLLIYSKELFNALQSRSLVIEKNMVDYVCRRVKKQSVHPPSIIEDEEILQQIEQSNDPNMEEVLIMNETNIMNMHKNDVSKMINREIEDTVLPIRYSEGLANRYLVARLAPNFAASCRVFYEIRKRCIGFSPESLFDFGSGVGSATWAANSVWPTNCIKEHFLVDASTTLLAISEYLLKDGAIKHHNTAVPGVTFRSFLPASNERQYDIVVSCYSLLDISGGYLNRRTLLNNLWHKTAKFLVLVDSGTKAGFQAILEARNWLLDSTKNDAHPAQLFAPCPHSMLCPKADAACNFSVKYAKLRLTEATESLATETFSYVIFHKGDISSYQDSGQHMLKDYPRNVSYKIGGDVQDLCTKDGSVVRYYFNVKEKAMKRYLKRCQPGDMMPMIKVDTTDNGMGDS